MDDNLETPKDGEEIVSKEKKSPDLAQQAEILDGLPPEAKKAFEMAISMQSISGRMPNPILSKLTEEHITKILDQSGKEEENDFKDSQTNKKYNAFYFFCIILLVVFLVYFLADKNKELLKDLADKSLYALAGFGGGYGFKAFKDKQD